MDNAAFIQECRAALVAERDRLRGANKALLDALALTTDTLDVARGIMDEKTSVIAGGLVQANRQIIELVGKAAEFAQRKAEQVDTARLDFVLQAQAFIVTAPSREQHGTLYQLWTQDEDENFHIISGDGHFFISQRAAIDAAIAKVKS